MKRDEKEEKNIVTKKNIVIKKNIVTEKNIMTKKNIVPKKDIVTKWRKKKYLVILKLNWGIELRKEWNQKWSVEEAECGRDKGKGEVAIKVAINILFRIAWVHIVQHNIWVFISCVQIAIRNWW